MARCYPARRSQRFGPPKLSLSTSVVAPTASVLGRMLAALVVAEGTSPDVGFGRTGLRTGIRTYADLVADSAYDKRPLLEVRPKATVTGWSLLSGNAYQAPFYKTFWRYGDTDPRNDTLRDVVAVQTSLDGGLRRVETTAEVVSTAGTYYYDYTESLGTARWDDGVSVWDAGVLKYDAVPKLYVHLEDNSNPTNTNVVAALGFYFATLGATHPHLGDNRWVTRTVNLTVAPNNVYNETFATIAGAYYRFSGYYSTTFGTRGQLVVNDGVSLYLLPDGINTTTTVTQLGVLADTAGEVRKFTYDFLSPNTQIVPSITLLDGTGTVALTNLSYQRVFRYNYFEPRMATGGTPTYDAGLNDALFGGSRVGVGQAQIINGDGSLEFDLGDLIWTNAEVRGYYGGAFADGTAIDFSDYQRSFNGAIQDIDGNDRTFSLTMQDLKTFYNTLLPLNTYSLVTNANMDPAYDGKPRPLLFGSVADLTPIRIDKVGDYGVYEIADCSDSPQGLTAYTAAYAYVDKTAADALDTAKRLTLVSGTDFTPDLANGRFTIIRDVQPYIVDATNNKINFDVGAAELTATITVGTYSATALAAELQVQLRAAVGGADTTMTSTYSDSTHKFTIAKSSGTLNLRTSTGTNKDISAYSLIGFHKDANRTAALSYLGDDVTFTTADKAHIIRFNVTGFKDTATGTYTGTASTVVEKGPDIVRYVLRQLLKKATSIIDTTTFANGRVACPQQLGVYIQDQATVRLFFDKVEFSCFATIAVDGSGMVFFDPYVASPGATAVLTDSDFLDFSVQRKASDIFYQVVVEYAKDPSTGKALSVSAARASIALKYGRQDTRTVETYLLNRADALTNVQQLRAQFNGDARRLKVSVKGKLLNLRLGQAVSITRSRGINPALVSTLFRVVTVRHSYIDGLTTAELLEAV